MVRSDHDRMLMGAERRAGCLSLVTHDLNNPLTAIRILAEMCHDAIEDPEMVRDMRDIIESADLATAILDGVASMARLERHTDDHTWFPLDLVELIQKTVDRPAFHRHVLLDLPYERKIGGDRTALKRAFTDVFVNAVRLADNRKISASISGTHPVEIRVRHPPPGIPAALRGRLFELYGSVEIRQNTVPVSAVGLAYARKVIREHGGSVSFEDGPGGTMDLVICLPS